MTAVAQERTCGRRPLAGPEEQCIAGRQHEEAGGSRAGAGVRSGGNLVVRMGASALRRVLRHCAERVTVDRPSFERALAALDPNVVPVIVPTHRSFMDFLLCPYLFYSQPELGIPLPRIAAAAEFGKIPILGRLLSQAGAFYIHRGLTGANADLAPRVREMVARREALMFFVEGNRSRSRQFLPPRRGLLRVLQATGQPCLLLPVAISYDRRSDELSLLREVRGGEKRRMTLRQLLAWMVRWAAGRIRLGRIHLACGNPILIEGASDVRAVARAIMGELQSCTRVTTHHLASFVHHAQPPRVDVTWLASALGRRGVPVLEGGFDAPEADATVERGMRHHYIHAFFGDALARWPGDPAVEAFVRANAYQPIKAPLHDDADDGRLAAVLTALFGPVRADYEAVLTGVQAALIDGGTTGPRALWQQLGGAYLPFVESALDDLAERGIVVKGDDRTCSRGPAFERLLGLTARGGWPRAAREGLPGVRGGRSLPG